MVCPDGAQYLATPHSDRLLQTHTFPGCDVVAVCDSTAILGEEKGFDFTVGFLNNDLVRVAAVEAERHLLLGADKLTVDSIIEYSDGPGGTTILAARNGSWLTVGEHRFCLWRAS